MITNPDSSQSKPEENNTQIKSPEQTNIQTENKPNTEQENNKSEVNPIPKIKESQIIEEEQKKEEEKKKEEPKKEEPKKEEEKKEEEKKEEEKKEEEKKENENQKINNQPEKEKEKEKETQIIQEQKPNDIIPENNLDKEPVKQEQIQTNEAQEIHEIQEIEEVKPEIKEEIITDKIKFTHPMNNYSTPESIKEVETCPPDKLFSVLSKRLNDIPIKLSEILKGHEKYTLICLYSKILSNFMQNQNYGHNPKLFFQRKDTSSRLKISDFDFQDVLVNELHCQLTTDEIYLILGSLKQKTETLYSYDEFIKNVYGVRQRQIELQQIYCECTFNFDDYIYSFRHFIQDNKIDYKNAYSRSCTGITELSYDLFKRFLNEIGFKLGNEKELIHLFCSLCFINYTVGWNNLTFQPFVQINLNTNVYLPQKTLFEIAERKDISEEDFCKEGQLINKSNKNVEWTKNIMNFTEETKKLNKRQYESFESLFKNIHKKCIEYDIKDLTKFFAESDFEITPDGDILIKDFKDAMMNIGVSYNVQLDTLINRFKNMKKKPKEMLKLVEFLSIYNIFSSEDDNEINNEDKKEKDSIIEESPIDNKEYVHKNAHRKFTQDDIDYIEEICKGLADIIIDELHESVTNFIKKKDKNNLGYITLDDFKDIMEHDLKIDYKSDIKNLQIFFDFITSNKMIEGQDIIETKKLINIITSYSERDKPDYLEKEEEKEKESNIPKLKGKGNVLFETEEEFMGTNAPNITSLENNKLLKAKLESEEENNKIPLDIINTQIISPAISFDKIMSDFAHYLFSNRIRFNSIFPSINLEKIINNQTISDETLKLGFQNANFSLTEKEFSVVMTHFDPINKAKVLVEDLKHEISKYEPKYFKQSYQKKDPEELENKLKVKSLELEKSATFGKNVFNSNLLNGMNKFKTFLERNKLSVENFLVGHLCPKKIKNENLEIKEETWINTFIKQDQIVSEIIPDLNSQELSAIYKAIDLKLTDTITLGQLISFFNKYLNKNENLIKFEDQSSLNIYIKNELNILFDNFDVNKNDMISFENFYKCFKSVNHKATKLDAQDIIAQFTNENPSKIKREIFDKIMYSYIQKELVIQKEEKDYIMNLFKEADIDKNGYLTRSQIKYLIKNKIGCNLTDVELDEILNKVDLNQENEIDIRDFIFLLDNINSLKSENTINTKSNQDEELIPIMNLNLNLNMYRKIRPKDFISLYSDLPSTFIPSFIREEQQKNNLLSSSCLKPLTKDDIFYEDIFPSETLIYPGNKKDKDLNEDPNYYSGIITYKKLSPFIPKINCKICFEDYATGVSSPDETLFELPNSQFKVVGRLLKISLFNNMYKTFIGNAISIDCIYKKEYQDRWYFEDDDTKFNNNIIIRYNGKNINQIDVVFEFVLVIQKKVELTLYTIETSCGWCSIPLVNLQMSRKERLAIKGGSPLGASDISEFDIRKKRTGFFPKLATLFEGQIKSECPIRIKLLKDFSNYEKQYVNYLPSQIICHSMAVSMISIYRECLGEYILNHKDYLLKCIKDEYDLANMFCKIADVPDAFRVMNEIWKEIIIDGSSYDKKKDEHYIRYNFEMFVKKINSILYAEKFKYNPLDPTELPRGDIKLMQDRDILLNSALRADQDPKFNKLEYKMIDYSYKPFTMDEINGQKGNSILEKFDEIITSISI